MTGSDAGQGAVKPSEQRGGTTPDEAEVREKGEWAGVAAEGMVPAELGGSDAPRESLADDPELGSAVLGSDDRVGGAGDRGRRRSGAVARMRTRLLTVARTCAMAWSPP